VIEEASIPFESTKSQVGTVTQPQKSPFSVLFLLVNVPKHFHLLPSEYSLCLHHFLGQLIVFVKVLQAIAAQELFLKLLIFVPLQVLLPQAIFPELEAEAQVDMDSEKLEHCLKIEWKVKLHVMLYVSLISKEEAVLAFNHKLLLVHPFCVHEQVQLPRSRCSFGVEK